MLLCKHFVFVHFLKTGGKFIKAALMEHAPPDWHCIDIDGHPSVLDAPPEYSALPCFGFVRNPWDWYVSAYHYFTQVASDPLFDEISSGGALGFAETLNRSFESEPFRSEGVGPMTYYFRQVFHDSRPCTVLPFEHLRPAFRDHLRGMDLDIPRALERAIMAAPVLNSSPRRGYRAYYDKPLKETIHTRDADLVKRFGYRF